MHIYIVSARYSYEGLGNTVNNDLLQMIHILTADGAGYMPLILKKIIFYLSIFVLFSNINISKL